MATTNYSECKFGSQLSETGLEEISSSLYHPRSSRLIPLQRLKPEQISVLFRLYGTPNTDNLLGDRILQGKDIEADLSVSDTLLQKASLAKLHYRLGISNRSPAGNRLSKIKNHVRNENKPYLPVCFEEAYSTDCVFRRKSGIRVLSRNQFFCTMAIFSNVFRISERYRLAQSQFKYVMT